MAKEKIYDVIIVGASAAGVAAGIYIARRKLDFLILSGDIGGEVATSGEINNYPGFVETTGIELAEKFKQQVEHYDMPREIGVMVEKVSKVGDIFTVEAKKGDETLSYKSKTVIFTTGVHPRHLEIPGEEEYTNKGVSWCTVCDGPLFKDKVTATVGGGNSANESGIMLSNIAKKVYVLTKNDDMKGDQILIEKLKAAPNVEIIVNANTKEIKGETFVNELVYVDSKTNEEKSLAVDGVFVHIGLVPNAGPLSDGVKKDKMGQVKVDQKGNTSVPGLFAAGDVTDVPYKQIAIATGQGVTAALTAIDYVNKLK